MLNVVNKSQFYFQARWSKRDQIYFPTPNNKYPDKINETITPSNVISERWERNEMCHIIVSVYCLENITQGRTQLSLRRGDSLESRRLRHPKFTVQSTRKEEEEERERGRDLDFCSVCIMLSGEHVHGKYLSSEKEPPKMTRNSNLQISE